MIRSLRSLGKTILLTTHYLDEAEQLADRVAVLREGQIIREGTPAELTGGTNETEVRYRQDGHEVVIHTTEPTRLLQELTAEALAEGRELEGLSGSPADARGRVPLADHGARGTMRLFRHQLQVGAAAVLAQPRVGGVRLPLSAPPVHTSDRGLQRSHLRTAGIVGAARRDARLRRGEHGVRRACAHPRGAPGDRDSEADPLDTATAGRRISPQSSTSIMIVFAIQVVSLFALGKVLKSTPWPRHVLSLALALALGAAAFAALGLAIDRLHPLAGRLVRDRERHRAADGLPDADRSARPVTTRRPCARSAPCCR